MKTIKLFGIALMTILCVNSCENQQEQISIDDELQSLSARSSFGKKEGNLKLPFEAKFFTKRNYSNNGAGYCTKDPYLGFNYQVGAGQGTHLGDFTVTFEFCEDGFNYNNVRGVLTAANGDKLYVGSINQDEPAGTVIPFEHPFYEAYFQDPFYFIGGTGRFEGASGGGMTNSLVNSFDDEGNFIPEFQTDHKWNGTIILPKN